jgi:hypothetical protein
MWLRECVRQSPYFSAALSGLPSMTSLPSASIQKIPTLGPKVPEVITNAHFPGVT